MNFSLILATYGRTEELKICLESLTKQTHRDFELIIVDQNPPGFLDSILNEYQSKIKLIHTTSAKGLSKARNVGLSLAQGDLIAFPDDDGAYPPKSLELVSQLMQRNPHVDGVIGSLKPHHTTIAPPSELQLGSELNEYSIWFKGMSLGIFMRKKVLDQVAHFDERLGLGAGTPWGSGEESDLLVRILRTGATICRCPELILQHDDVDFNMPGLVSKSYSYARGRMFALAKLKMPWWFKLLNVVWPLLQMIRGNEMRKKYYYSMFKGRLDGFFKPGI